MLTYLLALAVGFASLGLYATTFALPEVSRKNDLIWSGVGLFYALVLWVCAGRITGGVLLGQLASVSLIGWFGWQTMALRWNATPENERVNAAKVAGVRDRISGLATKVQDLSATVAIPDVNLKATGPMAVAEPPLTRADFGNPPKMEQPDAVKPTFTSFSNPDAGNPLGSLLNTAQSTAQSLFASWTKPKNNAPKSNDLKSKEPKNKAVYVRKSFKDGGTETVTETVTDAVTTVGTAVGQAIGDDDAFDFGETIVTVTETVTETVIPVAKPSFQSVTDVEPIETKVVEVLDEFGDAIDGLKQD